MGVSQAELMGLFMFPMFLSLILFISMIVQGRIIKAMSSLFLVALLLFVVWEVLPNSMGVFLCLLFGPWMICIFMFFARFFRDAESRKIASMVDRYTKSETRRILDPCSFYSEYGRKLTNEESLDLINTFDKKACDDFLSSIGYPRSNKESLDQLRQRCVDVYKKERIESR